MSLRCKLYVTGKTFENVRRRVNVQLVCSGTKASKLVSKPTFKRFKIINDSLTMVELAKTKVTLCKPIYAGFTILEQSKELMFSFHYHEMLTMFPQPDQLRLLFTDTGKL